MQCNVMHGKGRAGRWWKQIMSVEGEEEKYAGWENRTCEPTATVVVLSAPESREHLATAVVNADFSGAGAQTMRLRIRSMPCCPIPIVWSACHAEVYNSKVCDAVVAVICLSHSPFASFEHVLAPGLLPRHAHLTLKGHPVSCDTNDVRKAQKSSRLVD